MKILSFVEQMNAINTSALVYIRETIKREGEVKLGDNDYLCVPCHDPFMGELFNLVVHTIKADSIVGYADKYGENCEVFTGEWEDGTALYVADMVAQKVGELS